MGAGWLFCGCQWPMGKGGPPGGQGRACLRQAPTALGLRVVVVRGCMTGWGCVRWVGCMRDFDPNGVGVPRRGTLPGLRSGLFPSKKQVPAGTCFFLSSFHYGPSPQDHFSVVQHGGLAGGDGPLGFVELDGEGVFPSGDHGGGLGFLAVPDLASWTFASRLNRASLGPTMTAFFAGSIFTTYRG